MPILQPTVSIAGAALPEVRRCVTLIPAHGQSIPARVCERQHDHLLLVAVLPLPELGEEELEGMVLEWGRLGGRFRLAGRFTQADTGTPEVLSMSEIRLLETCQERAHERVRVSRPARLFSGGDRKPICGYTVDVSGGGMLVEGADILRVGDRVSFEILLTPVDPPIAGTARVVRIDPVGRRGMVYEVIEENQWDRIDRFVKGHSGA
jgi:PilZ domain